MKNHVQYLLQFYNIYKICFFLIFHHSNYFYAYSNLIHKKDKIPLHIYI